MANKKLARVCAHVRDVDKPSGNDIKSARLRVAVHPTAATAPKVPSTDKAVEGAG